MAKDLSNWSHARGRRHPSFTDEFDTSVFDRISDATDVLVTGVARNALLTTHYSRFESCLQHGGRIRFLLVDPDSTALIVAADRYYAVRDAQMARERVNQSIDLLRSLVMATGGDLALRLTTYPLSIGTMSISDTSGQALFVEYYTYRALGEPKFVLSPDDGPAYRQLLEESQLLWENAKPVDLNSFPSWPQPTDMPGE